MITFLDIVFIVSGCVIFLFGVVTISEIALNFKKVNATCISASRRTTYSLNLIDEYSGTYSYTFRKKKYTTKDKLFLSTKKPEVGRKYIVFVNPEKPKDIITWAQIKYYLFFILFGALIAIGASILFTQL